MPLLRYCASTSKTSRRHGVPVGHNACRPDQNVRPFNRASTSLSARALSRLYLACSCDTRSSLLLRAASSLSENFPHFPRISVAIFFLFSGELFSDEVFFTIVSRDHLGTWPEITPLTSIIIWDMILVFQSENRKTTTICQNIFYNIPVDWFQWRQPLRRSKLACHPAEGAMPPRITGRKIGHRELS
jgi:hypothetical protein